MLRRSKELDASWESMVPIEIGHLIKDRRYFGYREVEGSIDAVHA
jgi:hypothetical protein